MSNLFDFLTDLATNPVQQQAFAKEPDTVMAVLGLSRVEQTLLKSGNSTQIAAAFADDIFQAALCIGDPGPDPFPDPDPPEPETPDSKPSKPSKGSTRALSHQYA
jgi:hypothetical protein